MKWLALLFFCNADICNVDYRPLLFETREECLASIEEYLPTAEANYGAKGMFVYETDCKTIGDKI